MDEGTDSVSVAHRSAGSSIDWPWRDRTFGARQGHKVFIGMSPFPCQSHLNLSGKSWSDRRSWRSAWGATSCRKLAPRIPKVIDKRMAAWRKNCAKGDEKVFAKRLEWDGLDQHRARGLLGRVRRANPELPSWARLLEQMIESSGEPWDETLVKNDLALHSGGACPLPLKSFFIPSSGSPEKLLRKETGAAYSLLAEAAHRQWEKSLLLSWEAIAGETLDLEFTRFRTAPGNSPPDSGGVARPAPGWLPPETTNIKSQSAPPPTPSSSEGCTVVPALRLPLPPTLRILPALA